MNKIFKTIFLAGIIASLFGESVYAGAWLKDKNGWWYINDDRSYTTDNWQKIEGKWYYFDARGYLLTNTTTPDGKVVNESGEWVPTGSEQAPVQVASIGQGQSNNSSSGPWEWVEDHWRYRDSSGKYKNNEWFTDANGYKYHFDTFGNMDTGMRYIGGNWYHFSDDGILLFSGFDEATGTMSTDEGKAYHPEDGGFTGVQATLYDRTSNTEIYLGITNYRNIPLVVEGRVDIGGGGVDERWYSLDLNTNQLGKDVTIAPGETDVIVFVSPDGHALNFEGAKRKVYAYYILGGKSYHVYTNAQELNSNYERYYFHFD